MIRHIVNFYYREKNKFFFGNQLVKAEQKLNLLCDLILCRSVFVDIRSITTSSLKLYKRVCLTLNDGYVVKHASKMCFNVCQDRFSNHPYTKFPLVESISSNKRKRPRDGTITYKVVDTWKRSRLKNATTHSPRKFLLREVKICTNIVHCLPK